MPSISIFSAGSNARGQLANGNVDDAHRFTCCTFFGCSPGAIPDQISSVESIACGANHTLILLRRYDGNTEVWGCGDGRRGQLGPDYLADVGEDGDACAVFRQIDVKLEVPLEEYMVCLVAAGWETSYVVLSCSERSDIVLSAGADDFGNLGVGGSSVSKLSRNGWHIVDIHTILSLGDLHSDPVLTVLSLTAGPHHTVARVRLTNSDGQTSTALAGWGTSRHGQLGPISAYSGRPLPFISSPTLIPIRAPQDISGVALGNQHTVLLRTSGEMVARGSDRNGQLRGIETIHAVAQVGCTWNGTYALLRTGAVVATGSNTYFQLGRGPDLEARSTLAPVRFPFDLALRQASRLACGSEHVLCIADVDMGERGGYEGTPGVRREVWGWGWNEHGNLGIGGTDDVSIPIRVWPPVPVQGETCGLYGNVVDVWTGCGTSWVVVEQLHKDGHGD